MKAWLGPVKIFVIKGKCCFIFANGIMRKNSRYNVNHCRRKQDVVNDVTGSEEGEKALDQGFGEGIEKRM